MQITKDIAVFPYNYRSCLSQRQLVAAKRIVHSEQLHVLSLILRHDFGAPLGPWPHKPNYLDDRGGGGNML